MRVLVTGATGQVGSELVAQGKELGLQILAAGRAELDISRSQAVNSFFQVQRPDIVINAAAYTAVDKAESEPELAYAINRDGAAYLAEACAKRQIPLFHISTDYLFDGRKEGAYLETDLCSPQSIYGKSKGEGDQAVASILEQHFILRVSWVFGASGNNFVKTMLRLGRERDFLRIVADQRGGPTWAGAIAGTLLDLVVRLRNGEKIAWGTYHYSGQPTTTWQGFAEVIFEQAVKLEMLDQRPRVEAITTAEYPTPAQRPLNSVLDCQKIARELGISQPDWRIGLDIVLKKWKEQ
ncbi:MAG: dTDP-4-dehydrorhamnose reductase [Proteobacteria bacterium]|nr:dTDP-4-dehydrorhamnose reductase [Pseudomonadota bacterium]MBU1715176.1 dTDP-4-dehydrorhamnose reductase [Pseudomonadota bacterium]